MKSFKSSKGSKSNDCQEVGKLNVFKRQTVVTYFFQSVFERFEPESTVIPDHPSNHSATWASIPYLLMICCTKLYSIVVQNLFWKLEYSKPVDFFDEPLRLYRKLQNGLNTPFVLAGFYFFNCLETQGLRKLSSIWISFGLSSRQILAPSSPLDWLENCVHPP